MQSVYELIDGALGNIADLERTHRCHISEDGLEVMVPGEESPTGASSRPLVHSTLVHATVNPS
jgi:hypothetical protein